MPLGGAGRGMQDSMRYSLRSTAGLTFTNGTNASCNSRQNQRCGAELWPYGVGIALGGAPIGAPIVGWVDNHLGPRWALGIGTGAGFTATRVAVFVLSSRKEPVLA
jgi:hypothetical protein